MINQLILNGQKKNDISKKIKSYFTSKNLKKNLKVFNLIQRYL